MIQLHRGVKMNNRNIIIILVAIIVVLAAAIGVMLLNPAVAKEPVNVKITSDKEQFEEGAVKIQLTDLNNAAISQGIVSIKITDKNGRVVVDDVVKTDSKGKAKLDFDLNEGKYRVNASYEGNENYTANSTSQKLNIKEEVVQAAVSESTTSDSSSQRQEDQITSDGWNPEEHEVSRESLGDGNERVEYDDGYFRIVDNDGNIVTYGWG